MSYLNQEEEPSELDSFIKHFEQERKEPFPRIPKKNHRRYRSTPYGIRPDQRPERPTYGPIRTMRPIMTRTTARHIALPILHTPPPVSAIFLFYVKDHRPYVPILKGCGFDVYDHMYGYRIAAHKIHATNRELVAQRLFNMHLTTEEDPLFLFHRFKIWFDQERKSSFVAVFGNSTCEHSAMFYQKLCQEYGAITVCESNLKECMPAKITIQDAEEFPSVLEEIFP